ncbi:MAG: DMT family transporter [Candidatus Micrarchaeota archaeon]|nr:DMT family transporter [Candidatus Micrarchaeota archaeon]
MEGFAFPHKRKLQGILLLLLAATVWGSTFAVVKSTLSSFQAFALLAMRFSLATALLGAYLALRKKKPETADLKRGAVLGVFLFAGYSAQTVGLYFTTATNSAFITGLIVVIVPLLSAAVLRRMPEKQVWAAALLALAGLYFLAGVETTNALGDAITLLCALAFSFHILYTGKWAGSSSPLSLLFAQFFVTSLFSCVAAGALGEFPQAYPLGAVGAIAFLAIAATIIAQWAQLKAQALIDAPTVAILLLFEPISAAVFGFLLLGETLSAAKSAGALLILLAMLLAGLGTNKKRILKIKKGKL